MDDWRRAFSIILTVLLAIASLSLGALAWSRTTTYKLPTPTWIPATATLLSPILAVALATLSTRRINPDTRILGISLRSTLTTLNKLHTIISTILATLALAYIYPETISNCNIEQQWQRFFVSKNADAIRSIQDSFQCCGLRSTRDRAWPFKDRDHGDNACETQLGYSRSCIVPWTGQQEGVSWMVFVGVLLGMVIKARFFSWNQRASWMGDALTEDYRRITNEEAGENQRNTTSEQEDEDEAWRDLGSRG